VGQAKAEGHVSLIARSKQAEAVARHLIRYSPQIGFPVVIGPRAYRRTLLRLEKAHVLKRWGWSVDGLFFTPKDPVAGWLWLAGPRWEDYAEEARCKQLIKR
jgi:hypothetical protein